MTHRNSPYERFETLLRFFAQLKIVVVEIGGTIGLIFLIYQGLKLEMKW